MSIQSILFCRGASKSDRQRDSLIPFPSGVRQSCNISYGPYGKQNLLDVYWPEGQDCCPVIVNVHGGGFVYGNKEIYKRYCMDLARRGFTVVNINYRLAPRWKFPSPIEDIHKAMQWLELEHRNHHADISKIFMVGDSAGGQLVSQYATIHTNPEYRKLFGLPALSAGMQLKAVGLNCGVYDMTKAASEHRKGLNLDYLGRKIPNNDPRLDVLGAITPAFPPAHITSAHCDFLLPAAQPMLDFLQSKGIPCQMDIYGREGDQSTGHVFHINILKPEAIACNDDQCNFFRQYL